MSKNLCRMLGLILMLVSVFFLLGGLYLGGIPTLPEAAAPVSLATGLILLVVGVVFYRVLRSD